MRTAFQKILLALWCVFPLLFLRHVDVFKGEKLRGYECTYYEFR
jgi:hypothetical protein